MRIQRVRLRAAEARGQALERFYGDQLGLSALTGSSTWLGFSAGETTLEFSPVASGQPFYHFAFRVPRNRFRAARAWLARHTDLLAEADSSETSFEFQNWNAEACYAHDPCGNIVELIAHHGLLDETPDDQPFTAAELLGVCEVGLVGHDTRAMANVLGVLGIGLWDGALDVPGRLAFMGDREGTLILALAGRGWMPTSRPAELHETDVLLAGTRDAEVTLPGTPHRVCTYAGSLSSWRGAR